MTLEVDRRVSSSLSGPWGNRGRHMDKIVYSSVIKRHEWRLAISRPKEQLAIYLEFSKAAVEGKGSRAEQ